VGPAFLYRLCIFLLRYTQALQENPLRQYERVMNRKRMGQLFNELAIGHEWTSLGNDDLKSDEIRQNHTIKHPGRQRHNLASRFHACVSPLAP
jgi:hypothetical protein